MMMTNACCADCGIAGGDTLKMCKSCMSVKYCNAKCQRNHWPTHKKLCKQHAAELRDEALFNDPPAKEDCPICFLPMPARLISCISLPPATIISVPIIDFVRANENERLPTLDMEQYYPCCGKVICKGCIHSSYTSGNIGKCPFCNSARGNETDEEHVEQIMKRVAANDATSICVLGDHYYRGLVGVQQDHTKAIKLFTRAADLGLSAAHYLLSDVYRKGGDLKKAKFHGEAAAMAGHEVSRCNLGVLELDSGNLERAIKHWKIAASAGCFESMHHMRKVFEQGLVSRESINSMLKAYNNSCVKMRSEARDAYIRGFIDHIGER